MGCGVGCGVGCDVGSGDLVSEIRQIIDKAYGSFAAQVHVADLIEAYWEAAGLEIDEVMEGGWLVRRPNFYVAQIHLLGLHRNTVILSKLRKWFRKTSIEQVRGKSAALGRELTRLVGSKDPSDSKMFLNMSYIEKEHIRWLCMLLLLLLLIFKH